MQASPQLKDLLDQLCTPDANATLGNLDKEKAEQAIRAIHQGGPANVTAIIDRLFEPGGGDDVKPHFALHCLAVYVCQLEDKRPRREFSAILAAQLGGPRPKGVQEYLIQELQVCAGPQDAAALGKVLLDAELGPPAARALQAIGPAAAEPLRAALAKASGECRLQIIQALGALRDAAALDSLRAAAGDADREIRLAAVWGLANLADPGSVDLVLKAAGSEGWERIQATDACFTLAENLQAAGKKAEAKRIYEHLAKTRTDPAERYVREAAQRAIAAAG